ncbi:unnamed protein product, partial [Prunus brigantina]
PCQTFKAPASIEAKLYRVQPRAPCKIHRYPATNNPRASKRLSPKADMPSLTPKEDTLLRCQAPAETPDC